MSERPTCTLPEGPAVMYVTADGQGWWLIDGDQLDVTRLNPREKAICIAVVKHALARLEGDPQ